jgi:hypothetical protein
MKAKKSILSLAINLVILAAFTAICFLVRKEYTNSFYFSFGVSVFAFLMYVLSTHMIPKKKEFVILGYSPIIISSIYFIITAILNFIFILLKMENITVNLVFNILITAAYLVLFLFNLLGNEHAKGDIVAHKTEIAALHNIKDAIMPLQNKGGNLRVNKKLESLCDAVASAQIYRNNAEVSSLDQQIVNKANLLQNMLADPASATEEEIVAIIDSIKQQISTRNTLIKKAFR